MSSLYSKLLNIQSELKCTKSQYNKFGGYSYRSCEDILEAVKPLLKVNNVIVNITDKLELIGDRYYIKAVASLIDVESGEKFSSEAYAREEESKKGMDGSQVTGASSSYARKYALNGLFAIDDLKDSDVTNTGVSTAGKSEVKPEPEILGGEYIFAGGKHAGKTLKDVANEDNAYLDMLLASSKVSEHIKANITAFRSDK